MKNEKGGVHTEGEQVEEGGVVVGDGLVDEQPEEHGPDHTEHLQHEQQHHGQAQRPCMGPREGPHAKQHLSLLLRHEAPLVP